jgi:hypothetical protein
MTLNEIQELIRAEFGSIADKFTVHDIALSTAHKDSTPGAANPGVYVYMKEGGVVKVGRHLTNSRKRALEHIIADTGGKMGALIKGDTRDHLHWVCALEVFLETKLNPEVRSARIG